MKKKSIKVAKTLFDLLLSLLIVVSIVSLGIAMYNSFKYNIEVSKYIYAFLGVFLLPIEYLTKGEITGAFQEQANNYLCIFISLVLFILLILTLSFSSKMFSAKFSSKKRTIYGIISCILTFTFLAYFIYSCIFFTANYSAIENAINDFGPEFVKTIMVNFGFNIIALKEIIVSYISLAICLFAFVSFIIAMSHKSTKIKITTSINFYSSEYQEPKTEEKTKEDNKEEKIGKTEIPESDPKAQSLIKKIMQLEELKNAGKISNVDYTRLRQKAIKRYKR